MTVIELYNNHLCEIDLLVDMAFQLAQTLDEIHFPYRPERVDENKNYEQYEVVRTYEQSAALLWSMKEFLRQSKKKFQAVMDIDLKTIESWKRDT